MLTMNGNGCLTNRPIERWKGVEEVYFEKTWSGRL